MVSEGVPKKTATLRSAQSRKAMARLRAGSAAPAALLGLGACALACVALLWSAGDSAGREAALISSSRARFLDQLNAILLKKTNKQMIAGEDSVLQAQESVARAQRGRQQRSQFSKAQLAANACHDGEGCAGTMSPKPKMVYQPSTGNWVVEDAGNPDWIWHHLMQRAKQRDATGRGAAPPAHAAHVRQPAAPAPFVQNKGRLQALAQLGTGGADTETNKQTLLLKLKALLRDKVAAGEPVQPKPAQSIMVSAARDFAQPGVSDKVSKLKADISRGKYLGRVGDLSDMSEMSRLSERLANTQELGEICRRRHLAQDGLGVLKDSSLAGCEREIRAHMNEARVSLKGGLARLHAEKARLEFPKRGSLPQLQQKKKKLAAELSSMEKQHDQLRAELSQQRERITQLTQQHRLGDGRARSFQAADRAAKSLMGLSSSASSATPLADALMGRTRKAARKPGMLSAAARRHVPSSRAWSPPVPAGLPPGYRGALKTTGGTDVPQAPPPGIAP